jgi:hypothetical protein
MAIYRLPRLTIQFLEHSIESEQHHNSLTTYTPLDYLQQYLVSPSGTPSEA